MFVYCDSLDVLYAGNGYVSLHAVTEGEKKIRIPQKFKCTDVENKSCAITDEIKVECKMHQTVLYKLEMI